MSWSLAVFSRTPYSAGTGTELPPAGGQQHDPGGPGGWLYIPNPIRAWSARGWSGGGVQIPYPGGGVLVTPIPEAGVMRVRAWWPFAPAVRLLRVHPDGSTHPVRGGDPLVPMVATRRNLCSNPSFESATTGWAAAEGTPTLTRITTAPIPHGTYALRATIAAAGSCGVTAPGSLAGSPQSTVAFDGSFSARPSAMSVVTSWVNASGGALTPVTVGLTADQINVSVGQWGRQVIVVTPPAGAVSGTVKLVASGLPAGATVDIDGVLMEQGLTDGSFFDGGQLGGTWVGAANTSTSVLAEVMSVDDGECPLDVPVSYIVANPSVTGGRMNSPPDTLESAGTTWLTHPSASTAPIVVAVRDTAPDLVRAADQGVFWPIGRQRAVAVSAARRKAATGELVFITVSFDERDSLLALLEDMAPVLLRPPASLGYGQGMWLALGDLVEGVGDTKASRGLRLLSTSFVEVDPPSTVVAA